MKLVSMYLCTFLECRELAKISVGSFPSAPLRHSTIIAFCIPRSRICIHLVIVGLLTGYNVRSTGDGGRWWMKSHVTSNHYRRRHAAANGATGSDVRSRGRWIRWAIGGRRRIIRIVVVVAAL